MKLSTDQISQLVLALKSIVADPNSGDAGTLLRELVGAERAGVEVITADRTLTASDNGKTFFIGTDALTVTLPTIVASLAGCTFTFVNSGAAGNNIVTLSPAAADGVKGNVSKSAGSNADATTADGIVAISSGANGKDFINTKATANVGDRVTFVCDGLADWWITQGVGIWVSES